MLNATQNATSGRPAFHGRYVRSSPGCFVGSGVRSGSEEVTPRRQHGAKAVIRDEGGCMVTHETKLR